MNVRAYAAKNAVSMIEPFSIERREVREHDVLIEIKHCGVCHSDIHQVRDEWGGSIFPMVPGHEIIGVVTKTGAKVTRHKAGDRVGVGCFVDSCRVCEACIAGEEQFCAKGMIATYNSREKDGTPTYGGYSSHVVTDENYVLKIPASLDLAAAAPLLCAGITTYSPLKHWEVKAGQRMGVVGLGGLGHMAVKFGAAFGAEVTVFSTSRSKEADARRLGAREFVATSEAGSLDKLGGSFDFILNTVSAPHDLNSFLKLLKRDSTMTVVGVPPKSTAIDAMSLVGRRRHLAGSLIGGIRETQEMLDFCGKHGIVSEIEKLAMKDINSAYERMLRADVRYRFVIDMATL